MNHFEAQTIERQDHASLIGPVPGVRRCTHMYGFWGPLSYEGVRHSRLREFLTFLGELLLGYRAESQPWAALLCLKH